MFDDILEFLKVLFIGILIIIIIMFAIFVSCVLIWVACNGIDYRLDKSVCNAYVENQQVYSGRCHFIDISSIGENGNTKKMTIFKDIYGLKPDRVYVNNDIRIENDK